MRGRFRNTSSLVIRFLNVAGAGQVMMNNLLSEIISCEETIGGGSGAVEGSAGASGVQVTAGEPIIKTPGGGGIRIAGKGER